MPPCSAWSHVNTFFAIPFFMRVNANVHACIRTPIRCCPMRPKCLQGFCCPELLPIRFLSCYCQKHRTEAVQPTKLAFLAFHNGERERSKQGGVASISPTVAHAHNTCMQLCLPLLIVSLACPSESFCFRSPHLLTCRDGPSPNSAGQGVFSPNSEPNKNAAESCHSANDRLPKSRLMTVAVDSETELPFPNLFEQVCSHFFFFLVILELGREISRLPSMPPPAPVILSSSSNFCFESNACLINCNQNLQRK